MRLTVECNRSSQGAEASTIRAVTRDDASHEPRLAVLSALSRVLAEPGQLVALLAACEDDDEAIRRLHEVYDFSPVQAQAVLDAQLRLVTRARRTAVHTGLTDVRDALAVPWDPPLEVQATVRSPQRIDVVLAGVQHRVEGEDLADSLGRVVSLVRARVARPERRRVAVSTGLTDGPRRILVDPVGSAEFLYADEPR
ncbi:hypothetical protein SAMN05660642_03044 [Geodermatophilus siccatus]|uniref:Uncharacterized protein n=1 Tax=Geodermatophilus siccatus TaxID=1137991 RepID=A0A1G9V289_9ACTN|nr:hypothetical protein [Geodermatophilus siccatus]SDM65995.1 hypothetical protein SAMN05660642_03044 [Geodermatophilus siccatus]